MGYDLDLPPPVITDSTAVLASITHILCCSCGMYFSAGISSENDHGADWDRSSIRSPSAAGRGRGAHTVPAQGGEDWGVVLLTFVDPRTRRP